MAWHCIDSFSLSEFFFSIAFVISCDAYIEMIFISVDIVHLLSVYWHTLVLRCVVCSSAETFAHKNTREKRNSEHPSNNAIIIHTSYMGYRVTKGKWKVYSHQMTNFQNHAINRKSYVLCSVATSLAV